MIDMGRFYEPFTDIDLCDFWNHGAEIDDYLGNLEEELLSRGYETRRYPGARRRRRLQAGDPHEWQRFFRENSHYI